MYQLEECGYIEIRKLEPLALVIFITNKAIDKFQKTKDKESSKLTFIAIKFNDNKERIQTIQDAIVEYGFEPRIMNEYETNNWNYARDILSKWAF